MKEITEEDYKLGERDAINKAIEIVKKVLLTPLIKNMEEIDLEFNDLEKILNYRKNDWKNKNPEATGFTSTGDLGFLEKSELTRYIELSTKKQLKQREISRVNILIKRFLFILSIKK